MDDTKIPKVSIVVPAYNGSKFILRTLNSILSQSYKNYEIIVVDDASTDGTEKIIKKIPDKRIRYFRNRGNVGTSKARNRGLTLARGRYIAYCDHDDIWYKNHLKEMVSILEKNPDVGLVFAKYRVIGVYKGRRYNYIRPQRGFSRERLENNSIVGAPFNVVHRKECIDKVGKFSESRVITVHSGEDWDLWLRISDRFRFFHMNQVLGKYIFHGKNRSESANFLKSKMYIIRKRIKKYKSMGKLRDYAFYTIFKFSLDLIDTEEGIVHWPEMKNKLLDFKEKKWKSVLSDYCRGFDLYIKGDFSKARRIFKKVLMNCRKNKVFHKDVAKDAIVVLNYLLAGCESGLGNLKKAIKLHGQIIKMDKYFFLSKEYLALLYFRLKKYKKAFNLEKNSLSEVTCNMRGVYYMKKNQYQKAISFFKKALCIQPQFRPAQKNLKIAEKLLHFA